MVESHGESGSKQDILPRPLRTEEQEMLMFLLEGDFPGADILRLQVEHTTVDTRCGCGCPSIGLSVDQARAPSAVFHDQIPVEALSVSEEPTDPAVLLFVRDGYLEDLELMWLSDVPPSTWPDLKSLKVHVRE